MGQVWSTLLLCTSSGRILLPVEHVITQRDHFRIHPKLLIRGSWIFKFLSPLICLTISILSLGLFCGFFLLHICSVIHASSSDAIGFKSIPTIPSSQKGWVSSLPWLPAFPCSFLPKMGGWWNSLQSATLGTRFCIFKIHIDNNNSVRVSITSNFTKRFHIILFYSLAFCKCEILTLFSVWGHASFPSEYLTTRFEQNRICVKAQLYNDFSQWHSVKEDLSYSLPVLVRALFEVCSISVGDTECISFLWLL